MNLALLIHLALIETLFPLSTVEGQGLEYPDACRNDSIIDDFHGTLVSDPYRWLEDSQSPQTLEFISAQNNLTDSYLELSPIRERVREELTKMWDYPKSDPPTKHGDKYYYFANSGVLDQKVLFVKDMLTSEPEVFFDPNGLSENGSITIYPLSTGFSPSGKWFAYGLSSSGSDWFRIHFRSTEDGRDAQDVLVKAKMTYVKWKSDDSGVFYGAYPHMEEGDPGVTQDQKLFYHRMGTDQSEDVLIAEYPDKPHWMVGFFDISRDGKTFVLEPFGDGAFGDSILSVAPIPENITEPLEWTELVTEFTAKYQFVTSMGSALYFKTNQDAPNYKIIRIDLDSEDPRNPEQWVTIVPEHELKVIDQVAHADGDKLIVIYMEEVKSRLTVFNITDGSILVENYDMEIGTVFEFGQSDNVNEPLFFFKFESFLVPNRIYMVNFTEDMGSLVIYEDVEVEGLDPSQFETNQVFYPSKDGTLVPMFIVNKKGLQRNGEAFANLYGYGGFGASTLPEFSVPRIVFMEGFGGVVAIANIRGGGEYGKPWHDGGKLDKKQNGFDDFQAAAEYLIRENYTRSSKLVIEGRSNGGLLVGACVNQRPDLFGAAIPRVGVMDMLRYHLFGIGYFWISEYGSSEDAEEFEYIFRYSPLHNIRGMNGSGQYPAVLVTTSLQDDRVVPMHSMKYAAELQYRIGREQGQTNPLLIRIEDDAGHGGEGKPTAKLIDEEVDVYSFLNLAIGLEFSDTN